MTTYYCYQVDPEYQQSPLWQDYPDSFGCVSCFGNKKEHEIFSSDINPLMKVLKNEPFLFDLDEAENTSVRKDCLNYWFFNSLVDLSSDDVDELTRLIFNDDTRDYARIFSILTGKEYRYYEIKGSSQGEWNYIFWCYEDNPYFDHLSFECEYFNEGMEWQCLNHPTDYDGPFEFEVWAYTHGWLDRDIREELAREIGVEPEDIRLFKFDGYTRTPKYKECVFDK